MSARPISDPALASPSRSLKTQLAAFLIAYAFGLLLLLPRLSYWFDEVTDLMSIRDMSWSRLMAEIPRNPGGVPLSYLVRALSMHLLGPSVFGFRLPSALFSIASCAGIFILARHLKLRYPMLAVILFAAIPLQLRYAVESRPYSQALSLSVWMTVGFLALVKKPSGARALLYIAVIVAGLYSQPFTVFVPVAHCAWLLGKRFAHPELSRATLLACASLTISALLFLPWQLQIMRGWHNPGTPTQHYELGFQLVPLILHEITGAGYFGTVFLALLAIAGWAAPPRRRPGRLFWALYVFLPILLAIGADLKFHYFFATRQLITVLAPASILSAMGVEYLLRQRRMWGRAALAAILITFVAGDIHWFRKPREDWQAASTALLQAANRGSCLVFTSDISSVLLNFFSPGLNDHACPADAGQWPASVAVAIDPYGPDGSRSARKLMAQSGYRKQSMSNPQGPMVEIYRVQ